MGIIKNVKERAYSFTFTWFEVWQKYCGSPLGTPIAGDCSKWTNNEEAIRFDNSIQFKVISVQFGKVSIWSLRYLHIV